MKMHVGDEFFLSVLYPLKNVKDFAVTYDDWDYVHDLGKKIKEKKRKLYEFLSGKVISVQGWESYAINYLLS